MVIFYSQTQEYPHGKCRSLQMPGDTFYNLVHSSKINRFLKFWTTYLVGLNFFLSLNLTCYSFLIMHLRLWEERGNMEKESPFGHLRYYQILNWMDLVIKVGLTVLQPSHLRWSARSPSMAIQVQDHVSGPSSCLWCTSGLLTLSSSPNHWPITYGHAP